MIKIKVVHFLLLSLLAFSCKKDDEKSPSRRELLAEKTEKSWIITKVTPEDEDEDVSCRIASVRNADNYWIFSVDGTFEYDPGAVLTDPACVEDCCTDLAHLYGTWSVYDSERMLKVHIVGKIEGQSQGEFPEDEQIDLLDLPIITLTATKLVVGKGGEEIEFSVKGLK